MQSGPIRREIYERPPKDYNIMSDHHREGKRRTIIWKLMKLLYGIGEVGRQWLCAIGNWLIGIYGMYCVSGIDQLFVKRTPNGSILLLVAKVADEFLISGNLDLIEHVFNNLNYSFYLGATRICTDLHFLAAN